MLDQTFGWLVARGHAVRREAARARAVSRALSATVARHLRLGPAPAVALVETDHRGIIVKADGAASALFNVPSDQLRGMVLLHFVARRFTRAFRSMVKLLGYPQAIPQADVQMRARHGKAVPVRVTVSRLAPRIYRWSLAASSQPAAPAALERSTERDA